MSKSCNVPDICSYNALHCSTMKTKIKSPQTPRLNTNTVLPTGINYTVTKIYLYICLEWIYMDVLLLVE